MTTARAKTAPAENRTRQRNLVIRLSDAERAMIGDVAEHLGMNATQALRWLVRREHERIAAARRTA